jgi:MFS superfamily sulfate permease-like transporter
VIVTTLLSPQGMAYALPAGLPPQTAAKANVITIVIALFMSSSFRRHKHGPYSRTAAGCRAVVTLGSVPTWAAARKDDFANASAAATLARLSNSGRAI